MKKTELWAYLAVVFISIIWGTTYVAIRYGVMEMPPFLLAAIRQISAGLILLCILWFVKRASFPKRKDILGQVVPGLLLITGGHGFMCWAVQHIPTSLAALVASMIPIYVVMINWFIPGERQMNRTIMVGLVMGMVGMLIIFNDSLQALFNINYSAGIALSFLGAICWAVGSLYTKHRPSTITPLYKAAFQLSFGGLGLLLISGATGEFAQYHGISEIAFWSLTYMIVFGSLGGFLAYIYAISVLPVARVSIYAYINPLVTALVAWFMINEEMTVTTMLAFVVTLSGVYIVNLGFQRFVKKDG